ncbi:MAG: hypothetical protein ACRDPY_31810 [Streptosporangiaceae bacterium]
MLAHAATSLAGEDDDAGLNATQAAVAEDAARMAIRQVLAQTRGAEVATPALEARHRGLRAEGSVSPLRRPGPPDIIA